ncbi:MAG TPA: hypothetical protein VGJ80_00840 [Gemmatimonadales bacterium]|jgi:tetratricopeptide (TPR) repeat protein
MSRAALLAARIALLGWILAAVRQSSAQVGQISVRRPPLRPTEDTCDAAAYVRLARSRLLYGDVEGHAEAEAALIWASRLDPGSADPPYLLAVAVLRPVVMQAYRSRGLTTGLLRREFTPARVRYMDSLMQQAWLREPFLDFDVEPLLSVGVFPSPAEIRDPAQRGLVAYRALNPRLALDSWAEAIAASPTRIDLRFHRAHTFYWLKMYDSTVVELRAVLAARNSAVSDTGRTITFPGNDVLEYSYGVALERAGQLDSAKEAYHRALVANLGLYMARVRLSNLLAGVGDTAGAMNEIVQAIDIAPREPWLLGYYGYMLVQVGRPADAIVQLNAAVALDSSYSTPYFLLGLAEISMRRDSAAVSSFESFLARSARSDERRAWTRQRVGAIRAAMPGHSAPHE